MTEVSRKWEQITETKRIIKTALLSFATLAAVSCHKDYSEHHRPLTITAISEDIGIGSKAEISYRGSFLSERDRFKPYVAGNAKQQSGGTDVQQENYFRHGRADIQTVDGSGKAVIQTSGTPQGITLGLGSGKELGQSAKYFNISIPAGEYKNVTLVFTATDGRKCTMTSSAFPLRFAGHLLRRYRSGWSNQASF